MDPDQTAPQGAVWIGSRLFAIEPSGDTAADGISGRCQ